MRAFSPALTPIDVPIVDAAVIYDCPLSGLTYVLILMNALYVDTMTNNLIPPFVMREAGITVRDTPKIHVKDPSIRDHSISFPSSDLRIEMSLWGIFSYFTTRKPTMQELAGHEEERILCLTPEGPWDPHADTYARNEETMTDWEGNMVKPSDRQRVLLKHVEPDDAMIASLHVSRTEEAMIDTIDESCCPSNPILIPSSMSELIQAKRDTGNFGATIGSTNA